MKAPEDSTPRLGAFSSNPWNLAGLIVLGGCLLYWLAAGWIEGFDLRWMDAGLRWREDFGKVPPLAGEIRIIEVDNSDLAEFGTGGEYAAVVEMVKKLTRMGARSVVMDVLYNRGSADEQQLIRDAIAEAEKAGVQTVLPAIIFPEGKESRLQHSLEQAGGDEIPFGIINMKIDPDRIWRRYAMTHELESGTLPSLALAAFATTLTPGTGLKPGEEPGVLTWTELSEDFLSGMTRQADAEPTLLNFRYSYFSDDVDRESGLGRRVWNLRDFLRLGGGNQAGNPFQGAIVLFGYGTGLDEKATCMGGQEPGVVLHAVALSDLIQRSSLRQTKGWQDFLVMLGIGLIALGLFARVLRKRILFGWAVIGILAMAVASIALLWEFGIVFGITAPMALWILLFLGEISRRHTVEFIERVRLDTTIGYYFSPHVLKHVREHPGATEPREADLTLMLTDVRNFTTLCEKLEPREMFDLLGQTFSIQTESAMEEDGSLQHFWGDQFVAYWGAPEPQPDAADRALRAAERIDDRFAEFREKNLPSDLGSLFDFGMGLHAGPGLVGNMGRGAYRDYSLFGDVVNSAARVESLTKKYGVRILATRQFCDALSSPPDMRIIDHVFVVGKKDVSLELFQFKQNSDPDTFESLADKYAGAFAMYQEGDFAEAEPQFALLSKSFNDRASELLAERCRRFVETPPDSWEGIYRWEVK